MFARKTPFSISTSLACLKKAMSTATPHAITSQRNSSVLGTSTLSPEFIEQFKEDIMEQELMQQEERKIGGIFASCIRKGELDHMESPASDERHLKKLNTQVDTLFSRLPEPKDPLKAARAPTRHELEESDKLESLKEAMRERYQGQIRKRRAEAERIDAAMKAVEDGTYEAKYAKERPDSVKSEADGLKMSEADIEHLAVLQELEETKHKMRELEKQIEAMKKAGKM